VIIAVRVSIVVAQVIFIWVAAILPMMILHAVTSADRMVRTMYGRMADIIVLVDVHLDPLRIHLVNVKVVMVPLQFI
jgi:hypothetical protein